MEKLTVTNLWENKTQFYNKISMGEKLEFVEQESNPMEFAKLLMKKLEKLGFQEGWDLFQYGRIEIRGLKNFIMNEPEKMLELIVSEWGFVYDELKSTYDFNTDLDEIVAKFRNHNIVVPENVIADIKKTYTPDDNLINAFISEGQEYADAYVTGDYQEEYNQYIKTSICYLLNEHGKFGAVGNDEYFWDNFIFMDDIVIGDDDMIMDDVVIEDDTVIGNTQLIIENDENIDDFVERYGTELKTINFLPIVPTKKNFHELNNILEEEITDGEITDDVVVAWYNVIKENIETKNANTFGVDMLQNVLNVLKKGFDDYLNTNIRINQVRETLDEVNFEIIKYGEISIRFVDDCYIIDFQIFDNLNVSMMDECFNMIELTEKIEKNFALIKFQKLVQQLYEVYVCLDKFNLVPEYNKLFIDKAIVTDGVVERIEKWNIANFETEINHKNDDEYVEICSENFLRIRENLQHIAEQISII